MYILGAFKYLALTTSTLIWYSLEKLIIFGYFGVLLVLSVGTSYVYLCAMNRDVHIRSLSTMF